MKGTFPAAVLWVAIARHFTFGKQTNFVPGKTLIGFSHWSCRIRSTPAKCKAIREQHISFRASVQRRCTLPKVPQSADDADHLDCQR